MHLDHAPHGGECLYHHHYAGGEFLPFYVPRDVMPQIDWQDLPALVDFLPSTGVEVTRLSGLDPRQLIAHQRVDRRKALAIPAEALTKPVLVSSDHYILDGNHRWLAHALRRLPIDAWQLALPFDPALDALFRFPKTYSYGDGNQHPVTF